MWIRFVSITLVLLLSGCGLWGTKPQLQDSQAELAPIPEELSKAYTQGLTLLKKEQYVEAEEHWQQTAAQWPSYPGVWSNLALALWHLEQYQSALNSAEKALAIDAEFCPVQALHGLLLREVGQFEQAIAAYDKALICDPKNPDIPLNLGILYDLYLQDLAQALAYYEQAQSLQVEEDSTLAMWVEDLKNRQPAQLVGDAK